MDIVIAATFTAEPLRDTLAFWFKTLKLPGQCYFTPSTPIISQLLDKNQPLHQKNGIKVLLVRLDDCLTDGKWDKKIVSCFATEFCDAVRHALTLSSQQMIVAFCPGSNPAIAELTQQCIVQLNQTRQVITLSPGDLSANYPIEQKNDPFIGQLAHMPYTPLQYCALGTCLMRKIISNNLQPYKVIVVDCDNTLWQGVCGEIGPLNVRIEAGHRFLQQFLITQIERGMLVCICSKNNKVDVDAVFNQHPDMLLKKAQIVMWKVNWQSKTSNLMALAHDLNLSLDSFILLDDDDSVCARMRSQLPMILTLQLPQESRYFHHYLQNVWAFDHRQITAEDGKRTQFYQQNLDRAKLQQHSKTVEDYLEQLGINIDIKPVQFEQLERISQLTQRTNQFNFTSQRYTLSEVETRYRQQPETMWAIDLTDHYGDYGTVGTMFFEINHNQLNVTTFLLSCRALGRKVEHAMLAKLATLALGDQCDKIMLQFKPSQKNQPAQLFIDAIAKKAQLKNAKYHFDSQWLIEHIDEIPIQPEGKYSTKQQSYDLSKLLLIPTIIHDIAVHYDTTIKIFQAIQQAKQRPRPDLTTGYQIARNHIETTLTEIWSQSLTLYPIGMNDHFLELGGTSILAAEIIARINKDFNLQLRIVDLLNHPTITTLTIFINNTHSSKYHPIYKHAPNLTRMPASHVQKRLWFLTEIGKKPQTYNVSLSIALTGDVNETVLKKSLQQVLKQYTTFQTSFRSTNGELWQQIQEMPTAPIETLDYSHHKASEKQDIAKTYATKLLRQPFHLDQAPLWRTKLIRLDQQRYWLIIIMHHILIDGWSSAIFYQKLADTYTRLLHDPTQALPTEAIQYSDYSIWEDQQRSDNHDLRYWQEYLANSPNFSTFPSDKVRTRQPCGDGEKIMFTLPKALGNQLTIFCHAEQVTAFTTVLAAINALLFRYTHQADNVIATPAINRDHPQLSQCIGMFANTLPIRTKITPGMSFRELVQQVRSNTLACLTHQQLPLQQIISAAATNRDLSHQPLFQIMLAMAPDPLDGIIFPEIKPENIALDNGCSLFDLTMSITTRGNQYQGAIEYSTALYHRATIERLLSYWLTLLSAAIANPAQLLSTLPLLNDKDTAHLTQAPYQTQAACKNLPTLLSLWQQQVKRFPEKLAVIDIKGYSYSAIDKESDQLAAKLLHLNKQKKSAVIAVCLDRSVDLIISMVAIIKLGAAYVPISPTLPPSRLQFILNDCHATHLIGNNSTLSLLQTKLPSINTDDLTNKDKTPPSLQIPPISTSCLEACAYYIYTSGSTGKPKGIAMPYKALNNLINWQISTSRLTADNTSLQFAQISFDVSIQEIWSTLCCGATLVITPETARNDMPALYNLIKQHQINRVFFPVVILQQFCNTAISIAPLPKCLLEIICSGEQLKITKRCKQLLQNSQCRLINQYGPSETHVASYYEVTINDLAQNMILPPIGKAIKNLAMYNLDAQLQPVPPGIIGELYIGGVGLADGYQNLPELTQEKFIKHPLSNDLSIKLYRTGDLVRCRYDGNFEYVSRIDRQMKLNGFRIEPAEIEVYLNTHPLIQESVLTTKTHPSSGKILIAYYVAKKHKKLAPEELRAFLSKHLPTYMIPTVFVALKSLPLTTSKKVDLSALSNIDLYSEEVSYSDVTAEQQKLLEICRKVIKNPGLRIGDNLFAAGAHSLLLTRLSHEIYKVFGVIVPLCQFYLHVTVFELATWLATQDKTIAQDEIITLQ